MTKTNQKQARAGVQRRYYQKNRDRLIARAKERYEQRRLAEQLARFQAPDEPIPESSESIQKPSEPKSLLSQWIQRLTGKND